MNNFSILITIFSLCITLFASCENDKIISDKSADLSFSTDTLYFDTVFTTIGSTTKWFTVKNRHDGIIRISSIKLAGGTDSPFRIGIDGPSDFNREVFNKEILPGDSMYVFVEVTLDPNDESNPLVIKDSVIFKTNGNVQDINLQAWGQDVYLYKSRDWNTFIETETWNNDKPHLIYGNVVLKRNHTLTLNPGVHIHLHKYSSLVIQGSLISKGTYDDPVIIEGDRLESLYKDLPGQWGAIALLPPSNNNILENTQIRNGTAGLQVGAGDNDTVVDVTLNNVEISNMAYDGILAYGATIDAYNLIIYNSQSSALEIVKGGKYNFYHTTLSENSVSYVYSSKPLLIVANNLLKFPTWDEDLGKYVEKDYYNDLDVYFGNSIIWGGSQMEILLSEDEQNAFNYMFEYSIIKVIKDSLDYQNENHYREVKFNSDPKFLDPAESIFELDTLSPAKDSGNIDIVNMFPLELTYDLNNEDRTTDKGPDMGAYERIEE